MESSRQLILVDSSRVELTVDSPRVERSQVEWSRVESSRVMEWSRVESTVDSSRF